MPTYYEANGSRIQDRAPVIIKGVATSRIGFCDMAREKGVNVSFGGTDIYYSTTTRKTAPAQILRIEEVKLR